MYIFECRPLRTLDICAKNTFMPITHVDTPRCTHRMERPLDVHRNHHRPQSSTRATPYPSRIELIVLALQPLLLAPRVPNLGNTEHYPLTTPLPASLNALGPPLSRPRRRNA